MAVCIDVASRYVKTEPVLWRLKFQIIAGCLLMAALAFRVWVKISTVDMGYKLAALRAETVELDMQRRELELQLNILTRPDRLAILAKDKFGLSVAKPGQVMRIQ